jgi:hypothetical protein
MQSAKITERIKATALKLLEKNPDGLRYSELAKQVRASSEDFKPNTIQGSIWDLNSTYPNDVYKPSRGLFRLIKYKPTESEELKGTVNIDMSVPIQESDFYKAFGDYLKNELEEVTRAIPLGGNLFKDKWGTPDVIGKYEPLRSDIIKAPTEIVSAEIKKDTTQLITAFGQACAYTLFSHRVYLVVPQQSQDEEIERLDSLCQIFGIGLVTFDIKTVDLPDFRIRMRAIRHEPDLFYTNKYMKIIEKELFG